MSKLTEVSLLIFKNKRAITWFFCGWVHSVLLQSFLTCGFLGPPILLPTCFCWNLRVSGIGIWQKEKSQICCDKLKSCRFFLRICSGHSWKDLDASVSVDIVIRWWVCKLLQIFQCSLKNSRFFLHFLCISYAFLMRFLCISYALFMHFLKCIRNTCIFARNACISYALLKSA